jgi:hypothetical protein
MDSRPREKVAQLPDAACAYNALADQLGAQCLQ